MTEWILAALIALILTLFLVRCEFRRAFLQVDPTASKSPDEEFSKIIEQEKFRLSWLTSPLTCDGKVVLDGLDATRLSDTDLRDVCLRMRVLLESVENERCEGRLLPVHLFDQVDTLEDLVLHRREGGARLSDWFDLIEEFGVHYGLIGRKAIPVDSASFHGAWTRYVISK